MNHDLFGVRKRGEDSIYTEKRDFLYMMPELVVKGAVFASDPQSDINKRLEAVCPGGTQKIRDHLDYMLDVLNACRRDDLSNVFDESKVIPEVYHAIVEGMGAMTLRKFNRLFRELTFTSSTGKRDEPIKYVDKSSAMLMYNDMVSKL